MIRTNHDEQSFSKDRRQSGKIVLVTLVVVIVLLVLLAVVGNLALTFRDKMETQNAADASARSAGVWLARGLNGISACQHLEGELLSMVAIHHAIGGRWLLTQQKELDESEILEEANKWVGWMEMSKDLAKAGEPATGIIAYNQIENDLKKFKSEATVIHGQIELMEVLTVVYGVKAVAGFLEKIPYIQVVGYIMDGVATVIEVIALVEWKMLKMLESVAEQLRGPHEALLKELLPALHRSYALQLREQAPIRAEKAAEAVASLAFCKGTIFPRPEGSPTLRLPLVEDVFGKRSIQSQEEIKPNNNPASTQMARSQLVRAAWPYTAYHRLPILKVMRFMPLSRAAHHFRKFTVYTTVERAREYYRNSSDCYHLMLEGFDPSQDKGFEPWTKNTTELDRLYSVMGFAQRKPHPTYAGAFLKWTPNRDGTVAFAQAQVYNANPQDRQRDRPGYQPVTGWDTLAWEPPPAGQGYEIPGNPTAALRDARRPKIHLNWQVRLVPVSRLGEALNDLGEPFNQVLNPERILPNSTLSKTH